MRGNPAIRQPCSTVDSARHYIKRISVNTRLGKKFKPSNLPLYSKTLEHFSKSSTEIVNLPALPDDPSRHIKACCVDTPLVNCGKKQDNPQLLKTLALEKIDNYKNSVNLYTDTSKTIGHKTSAVFSIPKLQLEDHARLNDNITRCRHKGT